MPSSGRGEGEKRERSQRGGFSGGRERRAVEGKDELGARSNSVTTRPENDSENEQPSQIVGTRESSEERGRRASRSRGRGGKGSEETSEKKVEDKKNDEDGTSESEEEEQSGGERHNGIKRLFGPRQPTAAKGDPVYDKRRETVLAWPQMITKHGHLKDADYGGNGWPMHL